MEYDIVVIGTSLGGLRALETVLGALPADFPLPVAVVQHRQPDSEERLGELLRQRCRCPVTEVEDKEVITPGQVYLAPSDYHLLVERGHFALSTDAPVWHARPAIDALFESAAETYGTGVIGLVLTGANHDGARGVARIKRCGGFAVVENPKTAESNPMPEAAIASAQVDRILPLSEIGPFVATLCKAKAKSA